MILGSDETASPRPADSPPASSPLVPTSDELRAKHPTLFDTNLLGLSAWWAQRWDASSDVGRVAAVGGLIMLLATILLSISWVVHDALVETSASHSSYYRDSTRALLRLHDAVRAEHAAASSVASAVWSASSGPTQTAAFAALSITAVPGAQAFVAAFLQAGAVTDRLYNETLRVLARNEGLLASVFNDGAFEAADAYAEESGDVALSAGTRRSGSRSTRDAALTQDSLRQDETARATVSFRRRALDSVDAIAAGAKTADLLFAPQRVSLSQLHYFSIAEHRDLVYPTLGTEPSEIAEGYLRIQRHLLRLALRNAATATASRVTQMFRAAVAATASTIYADALRHAAPLLDPVWVASNSPSALLGKAAAFVAAVNSLDYLNQQLLPGLLDQAALVDFRNRVGVHDLDSQLRQLRHTLITTAIGGAATAKLAIPSTLGGAAASIALMDAVRATFDAAALPSPNAPRFMPVTLFAASVAAVFLFVVLAEQRHFATIVVSSARDRVMEQTIKYVAVVGGSVRRFDLEKAQRATFQEATTATTTQGLATVHNRLERCVASLLFVAPTISPLLFPERAHSAARYYSIVRRSTPSGSGGGLMEEASALAAADMEDFEDASTLLTKEGVDEEGLDETIADRVESKSERRFGCFLFVDVSTLFEFSTSTESLDIAREYTPIIANVIEEGVVLHGGIFHSLQGHCFMGSWNVASDPNVPDVCEAAARAAYMLSARLNIMRRDHAALGARLVVSIALTAGRIKFSVVNASATQSVVQVTGAPLLRAVPVLRANYHHRTSISVDDTVADKLAPRGLPSKPIELLSTAMMDTAKDDKDANRTAASSTDRQVRRATETLSSMFADDAGRAHELISLARHRDPDLPSRLAEYKAAFLLYQRGYQAEALKGFRRYTKLYGYDGSVERIQSLILV